MEYLWAFLIGGTFCAIGQVLIDLTAMTPAKILVTYVVSGVVLGALGVYEPIVELAGAGATVPLTGFGYNLAKGVRKAVTEDGLIGSLTGGLEACAGGITAAVIFALIAAIVFGRGDKTRRTRRSVLRS
ncbi:MAG: stage V sporulation protein AE [Ruminiclostridium sp.]|nr:stage V sporulation protein AE [Ruminiclostridium sp.]